MFKLFQKNNKWMVISLFIAACEPSGSHSSLSSSVVTHSQFQTETFIQGKVSDDQGLIESGYVQAIDQQHQVIATATLAHGHYRLLIPAQTLLPFTLSVDLPHSSKSLKTVVIYPNIHHYDLNPLTTEIAHQALLLGGYTPAHLRQAAENSSFNMPKDPKKRYGGWH